MNRMSNYAVYVDLDIGCWTLYEVCSHDVVGKKPYLFQYNLIIKRGYQ